MARVICGQKTRSWNWPRVAGPRAGVGSADTRARLGPALEARERQDPPGQDSDALTRPADRDPPGRPPGVEDPPDRRGDIVGRHAVDLVTLHGSDRPAQGGSVDSVIR